MVLSVQEALVEAGVDVIVVDTAHGHSESVFGDCQKRATSYQMMFRLLAAILQTAEGAQALIDAGVDAVKIGIGPGSILHNAE